MRKTDYAMEFWARDWEWFACDLEGFIGEFTNAGLRELPQSMRKDMEGSLRLIDYFNEIPKSCGYSVASELRRPLRWEKPTQQYINCFADMSERGLFSHDTHTDDSYYLVTVPQHPLHISQLPLEIRELVLRTKAPLVFGKTQLIPSEDTVLW